MKRSIADFTVRSFVSLSDIGFETSSLTSTRPTSASSVSASIDPLPYNQMLKKILGNFRHGKKDKTLQILRLKNQQRNTSYEKIQNLNLL